MGVDKDEFSQSKTDAIVNTVNCEGVMGKCYNSSRNEIKIGILDVYKSKRGKTNNKLSPQRYSSK